MSEPMQVGWVYRISPRSERPWWAMVGPRGESESGNYQRFLGVFASQKQAFAAAEVALFEASYPGCCERCGWSLSSHGHSQYGVDCPWGRSPAFDRGHLRIVRRAREVLG
jgi:hypothetical protein